MKRNCAKSITTFLSLTAIIFLFSVAVTSSGTLYAADIFTDSIIRYDQYGNGTTFSSLGTNENPGGLVFGSDGYIYVSCAGSGTIKKVDSSGNWSVFASGLNNPSDLTFDNYGYLYVACFGSGTGDGSIEKIDSGGSVTNFASDIYNPEGIVFGPDGFLYLSDARYNDGDIYKYALNGSSTVFADGLVYPDGLAFDSDGHLYSVNRISPGTVDKFDSAGNHSVFASGLDGPMSIAIQIPEPMTLLLFGLGVPILSGLRRKR